MPLGHGYTIKEQITSCTEYDVIQIDIYPSLQNEIASESESGVELDITPSIITPNIWGDGLYGMEDVNGVDSMDSVTDHGVHCVNSMDPWRSLW